MEQIEEKQRKNQRIWLGGYCRGPSRVRGSTDGNGASRSEVESGSMTGLLVDKCREGEGERAVKVSSWVSTGGINSSHTSTACYIPSFVLNTFPYPFNLRDKPLG